MTPEQALRALDIIRQAIVEIDAKRMPEMSLYFICHDAVFPPVVTDADLVDAQAEMIEIMQTDEWNRLNPQ